MTGFGRGEAPLQGRRLVAEVRSVNHRFLELKLRLGRDDGELEGELGRLVRGRLERGAVTLSLREEIDEGDAHGPDPSLLIDTARALAWMGALTKLGAAVGAREQPSLQLVCAQPGVLRSRAVEVARPIYAAAAREAVGGAIATLVADRRREGEALHRELGERLLAIGGLRDAVRALAAAEPRAHAERLSTRLSALLEGRGPLVDPQRLAQEVAMLAERLDVTEELVRLSAHLEEARRLLDGDGPAGRKLDFLSQEIHREVNTIGSKAQSADIAAKIVEMKSELERFREQVQNVE
jgi:uncharacterized protein (TIGR00255 family)